VQGGGAAASPRRRRGAAKEKTGFAKKQFSPRAACLVRERERELHNGGIAKVYHQHTAWLAGGPEREKGPGVLGGGARKPRLGRRRPITAPNVVSLDLQRETPSSRESEPWHTKKPE
jgi:hypothetical protein